MSIILEICKKNRIVNFLIGMVIIGTLLGVENSQAFGCIIGLSIFKIENFILLFVSLGFLLGIKLTHNSSTKIILCIAELTIWIGKYLLYKGGYVTGFAGSPNFFNVVYDFIAIGARFSLLMCLYGKSNFLIFRVLSITFLIVCIKIYIFAMPLYTLYKWKLADEASKKQRTELIGTYTGKIEDLENEKTLEVKIEIDSTRFTFVTKPFEELDEQYHFTRSTYLELLSLDRNESYDVEIQRMESDSVILNLSNMVVKDYILRLKIER